MTRVFEFKVTWPPPGYLRRYAARDYSLNTHWNNERAGPWTRVEFTEDGVTFHLGWNHYSGAIVGATLVAAVASSIGTAIFNNAVPFWMLFPILHALITWRLIRRIRQHHSSFPFRITKSKKVGPNTGCLLYTSPSPRDRG